MSLQHMSDAELERQQKICMEKAAALKRKRTADAATARQKNSEYFDSITREFRERKLANATKACPLIKTMLPNAQPHYSLSDGAQVNQSLAQELIACGRLRPVATDLLGAEAAWQAV